MARTKLGAARGGQAAVAAAAGPQLHRQDAYLVRPSLVARPPPPGDWATTLPRNTTSWTCSSSVCPWAWRRLFSARSVRMRASQAWPSASSEGKVQY